MQLRGRGTTMTPRGRGSVGRVIGIFDINGAASSALRTRDESATREQRLAHQELLMTGDQAMPGWRGLQPEQRWTWFQQLYEQAAHLDRRYRLALRSGWWADEVQVEPLAALGAYPLMLYTGVICLRPRQTDN